MLRLIDGMDGHHGPGLAWNVGHLCFLAAFLLLGALVRELRALVPTATARRRTAAGAAAAAGLLGAACFVWVILGDLFPTLSDRAPLPAPWSWQAPGLPTRPAHPPDHAGDHSPQAAPVVEPGPRVRVLPPDHRRPRPDPPGSPRPHGRPHPLARPRTLHPVR
ncbi:hypothetical protein ACFQ3Z_29655 [Streptomyces nogalater]